MWPLLNNTEKAVKLKKPQMSVFFQKAAKRKHIFCNHSVPPDISVRRCADKNVRITLFVSTNSFLLIFQTLHRIAHSCTESLGYDDDQA